VEVRRSWSRSIAAFPVHVYCATLSWALGGQCRFQPTCSRYALQAIEQHGALKGWGLALRRLMRCHPFCKGGHDPVPELIVTGATPARQTETPATTCTTEGHNSTHDL